MLWYLRLCSENGVVVAEYSDAAAGIMEERPDGSGRFVEVMLRPSVTISAESDTERALALHEDAHRKCFIANSVNFPVLHDPRVTQAVGSMYGRLETCGRLLIGLLGLSQCLSLSLAPS